MSNLIITENLIVTENQKPSQEIRKEVESEKHTKTKTRETAREDKETLRTVSHPVESKNTAVTTDLMSKLRPTQKSPKNLQQS